MHIAVGKNPNCEPSEELVYRELEEARPIKGIRVSLGGKDVDCDVAGVEPGGKFAGAFAVKIADSGAGYAYLIYGGAWGIRIRPSTHAGEPWDFANKYQWGEAFKIYGSREDIIYVD